MPHILHWKRLGGAVPRLGSAALVSLLGLAAVWIGIRHAAHLERAAVPSVAALDLPEKNQGSALQREALRQDGVLPLYGSSELLEQAAYEGPFEASSVFRSAPTGFTVFTVARPHNACLIILQKLAALAPQLRGRRIVVSLSPPWFFLRPRPGSLGYEGNFSPLHASELAFSTALSRDLKRAAAQRMLAYPSTLEGRPLLRFALERLADDRIWSTVLYWAAWPLGRAETAVLRLQDHWEALRAVARVERRQPSEGAAVPVDWARLMDAAREAHRQHSTSNPYGIDDRAWQGETRQFEPRDAQGASFDRDMRSSVQWLDLELLLRGIEELGARALVISTPIHGRFYESLGMSSTDRALYYERVTAAAEAHGQTAVVFAAHDGDTDFLLDPFGHLSPVGWVHYDRALDAFFHGRPVPADDRAAP
jgi:D-alanine transfer protein